MKKFLATFFLILFSTAFLFGSHYKLSICAIFHNEDRFLKDWIDFHLKMGVEHFYLYNHQSEDDFKNVLKPYIRKGVVELIDWNYSYENTIEWNNIQCNAYNDALKRTKHHSTWVIFLDTDEYLYSPTKKKLPDVLKNYKKFGAVSANWVFYGTSYIYELDPKIPLIFQLLHRASFEHDIHHHVKSIVQPKKADHFINPHYPILNEGNSQVTEKKEIFSGPFSPSFSAESLRINHYWSRDEKFFYEEKMKRQKAWIGHEKIDVAPLSAISDVEICDVYHANEKDR